MAHIEPPKSPTLLPPRKSVELEDPGAHDLENSNDEEDMFTNAQDGQHSPIPTTRVEKVEDVAHHGEIPGTAAYNLRTQDAVPDELAVIPEDHPSMSPARKGNETSSRTSPVPKTVVEKIDPDSLSYGEVPGTIAHAVRQADAVPDAIVQAPQPGETSLSKPDPEHKNIAASVPRTVVTRVDSKPSHGEVPGTLAYDIRKEDAEPDIVERKRDVPGRPTSSFTRSSRPARLEPMSPTERISSPIAADGGFGPMEYDEDDDEEENDDDDDEDDEDGNNQEEPKKIVMDSGNAGEDGSDDEESGFGDDFDDFEEGAETADFGDFNDSYPDPAAVEEDEEQLDSDQPIPSLESPFPLLDFSSLKSLDSIIEAMDPHLSTIFPATKSPQPPPPPPLPISNSIFLTDRSLSLWSQLVAPPPLQPPNWVRSRIRRLFLVSLGVPVDLDEILPASKQKKLILPYHSTEPSGPEPRKGSVARLKQPGANASTSSVDSNSGPSSPTSAGPGGKSSSRRRRGPPPPPAFDRDVAQLLCGTSDAMLDAMSDAELTAHESRLEGLMSDARAVLEYRIKRKEAAVGDKEAFEGVIENLVKHARRVRK